MIKVVFIDIDGTLLNSKKELTSETKEVVRKCEEKGIKIILTSGRSRLITMEYKNEVGANDYIISSNGADVFNSKTEEKIYSNSISKECLLKLYDFAKSNKYKLAFNFDTKLVANLTYHKQKFCEIKSDNEIMDIIDNKEIVQCVISHYDLEKMKYFKSIFDSEFEGLQITNQCEKLINPLGPTRRDYYCDINRRGVSKGIAVKKMYEYLNISKEETGAIGDSNNDIAMMKEVGLPIAVENATEDLKKVVKYITVSNDENGVAKFLRTLIDN